uniref:uncharacterized protein LOC114584089 isoform X2 n=1 Tax=Podarcis muralis TaxID=64176 RepID=UPI00109FD0DB|nr:uncharacterized protein LOC114584089 isoform X2 [Podarcis muralis]
MSHTRQLHHFVVRPSPHPKTTHAQHAREMPRNCVLFSLSPPPRLAIANPLPQTSQWKSSNGRLLPSAPLFGGGGEREVRIHNRSSAPERQRQPAISRPSDLTSGGGAAPQRQHEWRGDTERGGSPRGPEALFPRRRAADHEDSIASCGILLPLARGRGNGGGSSNSAASSLAVWAPQAGFPPRLPSAAAILALWRGTDGRGGGGGSPRKGAKRGSLDGLVASSQDSLEGFQCRMRGPQGGSGG